MKLEEIKNIDLIVNPKVLIATLLLSLVVSAYWVLSLYVIVDTYEFEVMGAIYEFLWLPMLVSLFVLPVVSVVQIVKKKPSLRLVPVLSLLVQAVLLVMVFSRAG